MKKIFLLLSMLLSFSSFAKPEFICSALNLKRVKAIAVAHSTYDKNRHCTVSCMLALKCGVVEAMSVGIIKEIQDLFGAGTPDVEDLRADAYGVDLAGSGRSQTDSECLRDCDLRY